MSWEDRLTKPYYKSPSGRQLYFDFEDLTQKQTKNAKLWAFTGLADPYVQEFGISDRNFPSKCIFSGEDHDRLATAFVEMLSESGIGEFLHPLRGVMRVVPLGEFTISEPLKTAGNQSIVDVTFWRAGTLQPNTQPDASNLAQQLVQQSKQQSAQVFSTTVDVTTPDAEFDLLARAQEGVAKVDRWLGKIAATNAATRAAYDEKFGILNSAITTLIGDPIALATEMIDLALLPSRGLASIGERLEGYVNLIADLFGSSPKDDEPSLVTYEADNDLGVNEVLAKAAVLGCVQVLATSTPTTRDEAMRAIVTTEAVVVTQSDWSETKRQTNGRTDTGEDVEILQRASASALERMLGLVVRLLVEKREVLDRDWALYELCAKLYGAIDEATIDRFILSNHFAGNEILLIPRGRTVVWYV